MSIDFFLLVRQTGVRSNNYNWGRITIFGHIFSAASLHLNFCASPVNSKFRIIIHKKYLCNHSNFRFWNSLIMEFFELFEKAFFDEEIIREGNYLRYKLFDTVAIR